MDFSFRLKISSSASNSAFTAVCFKCFQINELCKDTYCVESVNSVDQSLDSYFWTVVGGISYKGHTQVRVKGV